MFGELYAHFYMHIFLPIISHSLEIMSVSQNTIRAGVNSNNSPFGLKP